LLPAFNKKDTAIFTKSVNPLVQNAAVSLFTTKKLKLNIWGVAASGTKTTWEFVIKQIDGQIG
jgi:hypothetical protein